MSTHEKVTKSEFYTKNLSIFLDGRAFIPDRSLTPEGLKWHSK